MVQRGSGGPLVGPAHDTSGAATALLQIGDTLGGVEFRWTTGIRMIYRSRCEGIAK